MRHRSQEQRDQEGTTITGAPARGKHRAAVQTIPQIPRQKLPTHDDHVGQAPTLEPGLSPVRVPAPAAAPEPAADATVEQIPYEARWRASHLPRLGATGLLVVAVIGTGALGVRYAGTRTSDNFLSLVLGFVVVVVLWALVIISTPQVVSLKGSILDIHTTGGSEQFDLADGLQPVDVVGNPRTSHWAVLLHRANGTTAVLRQHDVEAVELDPIVRHYRNVATQRFLEREARFNL